MRMSTTMRYTGYRPPSGNGEVLCEPGWETLRHFAHVAESEVESSHVELFGQSLQELRTTAQETVLAMAKSYTSRYAGNFMPTSKGGPFILTGHQPDFYHPGVWLKNFAAAQLAKETSGTAINLIIDSDLCRAPSVPVLTGTKSQPRIAYVMFDSPSEEVPYEERSIVDRSLWQSFGERVTEKLSSLVYNPLIANWWDEVVDRSATSTRLGAAIAQSRHQLELNWNNNTLEVPQSALCQSPPFYYFVLHLLVNAREFREAYNTVLSDYRTAHHLRNHAQPVPNLVAEGEWVETPFWVWSVADPIRRSLFVRQTPQGVELSNFHELTRNLPVSDTLDPSAAIECLSDLETHGIKIRTRALTTTMFARLFVADLFIHGIGGAKYDQVTDALCQHFWGFAPPPFATISGTLRLPIEHEQATSQDLSLLKQELRDMTYHPETYVAALRLNEQERMEVTALVERKLHWVHTPKTPTNAAKRHQEITSANQALLTWLAPLLESRQREISQTSEQLRVNQLLESRDYPFCLFPQNILRKFLLDFSL